MDTGTQKATAGDVQRQIDLLAKKRDHAADVLGKPLLAWSYQIEINKLAASVEPTPLSAG